MGREEGVRHCKVEWDETLKILVCEVLAVTTHLCAEKINLFLKNYRSECIIYSSTPFSLSLFSSTHFMLSLETEALYTLGRHQH